MNDAAWVGLAGIITSILVAVFIYGKLSQRVDDHSTRLDNQDTRIESHHERLTAHDLDIDRLNQWRSGFSDAASVSHAGSASLAEKVAEAVATQAAKVAAAVVLEAQKVADKTEENNA
jgi:hypothetical protein